jgi:CRISPR-associated protein Cas5d
MHTDPERNGMPCGKTHTIEVWGDFACFSRPELSVERFSYPCPTPSAARGIFDAIYCRGYDRKTKVSQFYWQVTKIELLTPPTFIALRRNEVKDRVEVSDVKKWIAGSSEPEPIWADAAEKGHTDRYTDTRGRTQRQTMALRNPRYRLRAHIIPRQGFTEKQSALDAQFIRRAEHGKCFQQPYFGCREFVCFFRYVADDEVVSPCTDYSQKLGLMLYDVYDLSRVNDPHAKPFISLFEAEIERGLLQVPPFGSDAVLKPARQGRR